MNEWRSVVGTALIAASLAAAGAAEAKDRVIHAGRLIDGRTDRVRTRVSILVRGDRIVSVTDGFSAPDRVEVIDLSSKTVLPGLIDTHDHLGHSDDRAPINRFVQTRGDIMVRAVANARRDLEQGFTTVRDVGSDMLVAPALKRSIAAGLIPGPRIWSATAYISGTGGHGDPANGYRPDVRFTESVTVADGPEEYRRAVRYRKREGADLIKIMPSGGVMSNDDDPTHYLMTDDEVRAVIETAHELGMKVAAHAHGRKAIARAATLGVDSIEHGTYGDDKTDALMRKHGTYLVPTLLVADEIFQTASATPEAMSPSVMRKALEVAPITLKNAARAYRNGVKMAFGSDKFGISPRPRADEFVLLRNSGVPPFAAIAMATRYAADLIGSQEIGVVEAGRFADIIAVDGDPIADISELRRVTFVMKAGEVFHFGRALTGSRE